MSIVKVSLKFRLFTGRRHFAKGFVTGYRLVHNLFVVVLKAIVVAALNQKPQAKSKKPSSEQKKSEKPIRTGVHAPMSLKGFPSLLRFQIVRLSILQRK